MKQVTLLCHALIRLQLLLVTALYGRVLLLGRRQDFCSKWLLEIEDLYIM